MNEPLENLYFNWLCAKVMQIDNPTPSLTYWNLLRTLHNTEFVWLLSGDDNRAMDGLELRREFILYADIPDQPDWRHYPGCSMLEMFIAFSRRTAFQTSEPPKEWFWRFMRTLKLHKFNDAAVNKNWDIVDDILNTFIWRTYHLSGAGGGLFPIKDPRRDQREVEIWYQFCDHLMDIHWQP